ncbi:MAG TPA: hypothetical protein VD978_20150 [Azospirillum sp.]|nr:hypothetical protein [Azospirillum sp.]
MLGQGGNDRLYGEDDADWLEGGAGDDNLDGSNAADTLVGNDGADVFRFTALTDSSLVGDIDIIADFNQLEGDTVDLSLLDAIAGAGDDAFVFIGNTAFSGAAGGLAYACAVGYTFLQADTDGDGYSNFDVAI